MHEHLQPKSGQEVVHRLGSCHGLWTGSTDWVRVMVYGLGPQTGFVSWSMDWVHRLSSCHGLWTGSTDWVCVMVYGPQSTRWSRDQLYRDVPWTWVHLLHVSES